MDNFTDAACRSRRAWAATAGSHGRKAEINIRESIQIILQTAENERINLPGFGAGLQLLLFEPNTVATQFQIQDRITKALQLWEPRLSIASVDVQQDPADARSAIANIQYKLISTQVTGSMTMNFQLAA